MTCSGMRIGIMGGTFDPIHYGHLMLAEQIRTEYHLDQVVFIPVGNPPHKDTEKIGNKRHRYEMVCAATASNARFSVSDIEVAQEGVTYTIDTIKALKAQYAPEDIFFFITGADVLLEIETWKAYETLLKQVRFIGATRPGTDAAALCEKVASLNEAYDAGIELFHLPALAISSTDIRNRVFEGRSIKYLLPENVEMYIEDAGLYRAHHPLYARMKAVLRERLSKKRFRHSMGVASAARALALKYDASPESAEFAGLCHDYAKELSLEEMTACIDVFGIEKDPSILENPNIAHGEVGAALLKRDHGIQDEDILDAIRWHTYGTAQMSLLSKIIYVADIIEPGRHFKGVSRFRCLAFQDMNACIVAFEAENSQYLKAQDALTHRNTPAMLETIKNDMRMETDMLIGKS